MNKKESNEISMPNRQMTLYYDEIYSSGLDQAARFPVDRYAKIAEKISEEIGKD